jgi:uncharacterized protein YjbK
MLPKKSEDAPFIYSGLVGLDRKSLDKKKRLANVSTIDRDKKQADYYQDGKALTKREMDIALRKAMNSQHKPVTYSGPGVARCSQKKGDLYAITATHKGTNIQLNAVKADGNKKKRSVYKGTLKLNKEATRFVHRKNFAKIGKEKATGHYVIYGSFFDKGCEVAYRIKRKDKKYTSLK